MILIVDDEPSTLVLLEMILRRDNFAVRKAATGREALRLLDREDEQECELLITDIRMPEMDGRQLVTQLRSNPRTASIPVVMCTSTADRTTVLALVGQGVRDYIVKPISASMLLAKVHSVLTADEPVMEPRNRTISRLMITPGEYKPLALSTAEKLQAIETELDAALRGRSARTIRGVAEKVREPASWFGGKRSISAARVVLNAAGEQDAIEAGEALATALMDFRTALKRVATSPLPD
jgi:DNA-binding response OmpR family regulator